MPPDQSRRVDHQLTLSPVQYRVKTIRRALALHLFDDIVAALYIVVGEVQGGLDYWGRL